MIKVTSPESRKPRTKKDELKKFSSRYYRTQKTNEILMLSERKDRLHFKTTFKIQIATRQARRWCNDIESREEEITVNLELFISENIFQE